MAALRTGLADPGSRRSRRRCRSSTGTGRHDRPGSPRQDDPGQGREAIRRFGALIRATPSLRAYQSDMIDQFIAAAAEVLAARAGMNADDPEPQIAARSLLGLWRVQASSLRRHLDGAVPAERLRDLVSGDVRRAARLIEAGLHGFAAAAPAPEADRGGLGPAGQEAQEPRAVR